MLRFHSEWRAICDYIGSAMRCIAMTKQALRIVSLVVAMMPAQVVAAQDSPAITATNLGRLQSDSRIDFSDLPGEMEIGFFAANRDASEFIVFDRDNRIYLVVDGEIKRDWSYRRCGQRTDFLAD